MKRLSLSLAAALALLDAGGGSVRCGGPDAGDEGEEGKRPRARRPRGRTRRSSRRLASARTTLEGSARLQSQQAVWDKVIGRYRLVAARYPRSGYSDDALLAVGDLSREMARRFKKPGLVQDAVRAYETLADEYPSSRHAEPALFAVFEIAQASERQEPPPRGRPAYVDAFPDSPRAGTVKAAIRTRAPEKAAALPSPPPPGLAVDLRRRVWTGDAATRVVVDLERKVPIDSDRISDPDRLWIDLKRRASSPEAGSAASSGVDNGLLERVRVAPNRDGVVRMVLDFREVDGYNLFYLEDPLRLVVDVKGTMPKAMASAAAARRQGRTRRRRRRSRARGRSSRRCPMPTTTFAPTIPWRLRCRRRRRVPPAPLPHATRCRDSTPGGRRPLPAERGAHGRARLRSRPLPLRPQPHPAAHGSTAALTAP